MVTRLQLNHSQDWLLSGSHQDPRLFHADSSDQVRVVPPHLGQGYRQTIQLRDDLSLTIHDYQLSDELVMEHPGESDRLEFEFHLPGSAGAGKSEFVPRFGFKQLTIHQAKRIFKFEIVFQQPSLMAYFQAVSDRLPPRTQAIAERFKQAWWQLLGRPSMPPGETFNQMLRGEIVPPPDVAPDQLPGDLYTDAIAFKYANHRPITPAMEPVMGQILSCPYQGATRRAYLERKVLTLVTLYLEGMTQSRLNQPCLKAADLDCIHQAAAILRQQIANPPTIAALTRQVCLNRLKVTQGFHQVYGTTPFGYLRDCRLWQARRLLITTPLSTEQVATAVGYASRNHFAKAFRQGVGINPKAFQMQVQQWQLAS
ncbi:MAG: helix-turn-helix transcriptional regulator [Leptolyngbyaceae cyanobacterium]|mgnify:CR=1 FL=1